MIVTIPGGSRTGEVTIPASKSQAHRQLISAALSENDSVIICDTISKDIEATIKCLNGAGASISVEGDRIKVSPVKDPEKGDGELFCGESGSTLRFLIPVVGAIGKTAVFHMEGRLPERPIGVYTDELQRHGMKIEKDGNLLKCSGQLESGIYTIPGNISSQFITGLLFALPILKGDSKIVITESLESADYIAMTEDALKIANISFHKGDMLYEIPGGQTYDFPKEVRTEADWSSAAFLFGIGASSKNGIAIRGLSRDSSQGDRRIADIVKGFGADVIYMDDGILVRKNDLKAQIIDASAIPDLVPAISAVAAFAEGRTQIIHAERLRIKESDRLKAVKELLESIGANAEETADGLIIDGIKKAKGGTVDSANDHRIAMTAAVAAINCSGEVIINNAECISKSYPGFWKDFMALEVEK